MFRTTHIDLRHARRFIRSHNRLVLLLSLLLAGVVIGCLLFTVYGKSESAFLGTVLTVEPLQAGVKAALSALYNACFQSLLLLLILFFCGLSACGLPIILLVPLFFGLGIGMSEAYYYSTGWKGVLLTVVLLLPPVLFKATALLMAAAESMRMTLLFGGKLLGSSAATEDMRNDFRLYILRFAIFALIALIGGIADVLLKMCCGTWLSQ